MHAVGSFHFMCLIYPFAQGNVTWDCDTPFAQVGRESITFHTTRIRDEVRKVEHNKILWDGEYKIVCAFPILSFIFTWQIKLEPFTYFMHTA